MGQSFLNNFKIKSILFLQPNHKSQSEEHTCTYTDKYTDPYIYAQYTFTVYTYTYTVFRSFTGCLSGGTM